MKREVGIRFEMWFRGFFAFFFVCLGICFRWIVPSCFMMVMGLVFPFRLEDDSDAVFEDICFEEHWLCLLDVVLFST